MFEFVELSLDVCISRDNYQRNDETEPQVIVDIDEESFRPGIKCFHLKCGM